MGVYYYFYNKTKLFDLNRHVLSGLFCHFISNFDTCSHESQIEGFENIIKLNKWSSSDEILAVPDYEYKPIFLYQNRNISINKDIKPYFYTEKTYNDEYKNILTILDENKTKIGSLVLKNLDCFNKETDNIQYNMNDFIEYAYKNGCIDYELVLTVRIDLFKLVQHTDKFFCHK